MFKCDNALQQTNIFADRFHEHFVLLVIHFSVFGPGLRVDFGVRGLHAFVTTEGLSVREFGS